MITSRPGIELVWLGKRVSDLVVSSGEPWSSIGSPLLGNEAGARRGDDHRMINGMRYAMRTGWRCGASEHAPSTTIDNGFDRPPQCSGRVLSRNRMIDLVAKHGHGAASGSRSARLLRPRRGSVVSPGVVELGSGGAVLRHGPVVGEPVLLVLG
jgi:hypothetical protein